MDPGHETRDDSASSWLGVLLGSPHFTDEKAAGCRIVLLMLATIGPSFSLSARPEIHAGSAMNALHFFSRSASDSQASR